MLLGNEAFADAADPTIGFPTDSLEYGSIASSIFAFHWGENLQISRSPCQRISRVLAP